ncbi:hypothetical protein BD410DRAFT_833986 [Rickenella mellea]|uniref:Uncharacterized protein n=1 Tax=Rickenella mellea TaxID=50990 RepID=A0A4R5XH30_9AGAM|nr:hypothetical protein BD410DRAFT_833986 [Rickenella mellea]
MTFRTHRVPPASIQRGKSQKAIRVMRRTCDACGHLSDQSFPAPNAILFRKVSLAPYGKPPSPPTQLHSASDTPMASASTPSSTDVHIHLPRLTQSVPIIPPTSPHPTTPTVPSSSTSKRSKKKSGLQELLARKRDQEQRRGDSEGNGLAAFLNGL